MNFLKRGMLISLSTAMVAVLLLLLRASPARAVDEVESAATGGLDVFQLDGADTATANADSCVGSEGGPCSSANEENPSWPADWDPLVNPSLTNPSSTFLTGGGSPGAAGTFATPWGPNGTFSGILSSTFVNSTTTLLKQGSKNIDDISKWVIAAQSSPPKDAIVAGAVATYTGPSGTPYAGHELLYNGLTRFSSNGSSTLGIWFFQQNVQLCATGTSLCVGNTTTPAHHQIGDLFLFITFSGSGFATIQAAEWTASGLGNVPGTVTACPTANNDVCEVTNTSDITLGAPLHTPTGGSPIRYQEPGYGFNVAGSNFPGFPLGVVPALQFQEGGTDLNAILGGPPPCFGSVLFASVSSGSSPSTASLKAILLGTINTCTISPNKTCSNPTFSAPNLTYPIFGAVKNTGAGTVTNFSITDSPALDPGSLKCYIPGAPNEALPCNGDTQTTYLSSCASGSAGPGQSVCYQGKFTTSTQNGGSDTIMVTATGAGGGTALCADGTNPPCAATANCPTFSENVNLFVSKSCTAFVVPVNGLLEVEVDAGGTVTNTIPAACSNSSGTACTTDANCTVPNEECNTSTSKCFLPCVTAADCGGAPNTCGTPSTNKLDTLKNVTVTDSTGFSKNLGSLAPGASATYMFMYNPSKLGVCAGGSNAGKACALNSDCLGSTCTVTSFTDTVTATGQCNDSLVCQSALASDKASASCPLCPVNVK